MPFYEQCLAPLGIVVIKRQPQLQAVTLQHPDMPIRFWIGEGDPEWKANAGMLRLHLAFRADSTVAVDAFYEIGMRLGAKDNGPPGFRRPTSYEAFMFDPEGNNIEAIWQTERPFPSGSV
ncbi:glyoxalase [Devosia nitrariae]|uniref:Glyoxalase n=1 Tax=Devosia nitrariae TaxID=2071872 RepID=A0ABQ5W1Y6_9HYPH|nr:glyoxalase [Devosia nitrariae]